jgi:L-alanine-DL-glutamate epimerase-like enolase superfamily enzyme
MQQNLQAADSLFVKVTTDQGLEGWGETFGFRAVTSAKLAIDELIAPLGRSCAFAFTAPKNGCCSRWIVLRGP